MTKYVLALKNMESLILKGIAGDMTAAVQSTVGTYWKTNMKGYDFHLQ